VQDFITFIHKREQKLEKLNAAASFANTPKELQRTAKITTDREISKNLETTFTTILKSLKTLDGLFADPRMKAFLDDKMHENDDPK